MTSVRVSTLVAGIPQHRRHLLMAACLLGLIACVYWPGLQGGYAFDDFSNIVFNRTLQVTSLDWATWFAAAFSSPASDLQRPLAMLTFAINHYFTGLDPVPMKLTNLAIHLLNTLLVMALMRSLLQVDADGHATPHRREWTARFVTAAWALHPINLMPVLFVVQRMESLSHTFVFAGLWLYLLGRRRQLENTNGWVFIGSGLLLGTGLGVLSKESAVLLPLYAFCVEACLFGFRHRGGSRDRRLYLLYTTVLALPAMVAAAWLLPRALAPSAFASRHFTLGERLLTEGRVVMDYLQWSVFPSLRELGLHHDDYLVSRGLWNPPSTLLALISIGMLLTAAGWLRNRRPLTSLGIFWFLGAQLLTATIIPLELVHEHRNYFASLGVCLAIGDVLLLVPSQPLMRRLGVLFAALAVTAFALTTHLRAREWSDPLRFAITEAAKHPQSPRATYTLGQTLVITSGYRHDSPLLEQGRLALERARNIPRSGILPHSSLLLLSANSEQPIKDLWWLEMQERLRNNPVGPQEVNAISSLKRCAGEHACRFPHQRMVDTFEAALSRGPNADVLTIYGDYALSELKDPALALRLWHAAVARKPRTAQYRINLAKLLIAAGRYEEARQQIAVLRRLGRFGQNELAAADLDRRLRSKQSADPDEPRS